MADRYDDISTADLLREVCRKLDRIEKQGAPKVVALKPDSGRQVFSSNGNWTAAPYSTGTIRRPGSLCGY